MTAAELLIRATTAPTYDLPAYRYWNAAQRRWGRYDTATRYPSAAAAEAAKVGPGPAPTSTTQVVPDHDADLDGYPMMDSEIGWVRLTACCAAACSISDGPLYCKSCYREQPWEYDGPARTPQNPQRSYGGPVVVTLPPSSEVR